MTKHKPAAKSKLYKLKQWLTVPETAHRLAVNFGEEVSEADVLRLALHGHLTLSVNFVNHAQAILGNVVSFDQAQFCDVERIQKLHTSFGTPLPDDPANWPPQLRFRGTVIGDRRVFEPSSGDLVTIDSIWDLPLVGGERVDVEDRIQQLTGGPEVTLVCLDGSFVRRGEWWCQLHDVFYVSTELAARKKRRGRTSSKPTGGRSQPAQRERTHCPSRLPDDCMFVVRTDALTQLEQSASDADDRADKPLLATERTTLLTTIAALAKAAGLNWDKPGQAAARIAAMTQGLGAPVSVRALQDHLSRIPDALERRSRS